MATPTKVNLQRRLFRPVPSARFSDREEDELRIERNRRACAKLLRRLQKCHPEHAPRNGRERPGQPLTAVFVTAHGAGTCRMPRNALAGI
jgi:outer membrane lipopolysaccharide assembly protein LptE/RlpB